MTGARSGWRNRFHVANKEPEAQFEPRLATSSSRQPKTVGAARGRRGSYSVLRDYRAFGTDVRYSRFGVSTSVGARDRLAQVFLVTTGTTQADPGRYRRVGEALIWLVSTLLEDDSVGC